MNDMSMKDNFFSVIAEALADDIYDGWLKSAQSPLERDESNNTSEVRGGSLRKLSAEAAVTAIGFMASLYSDAVIQIKQNIENHGI